MKKMVYIVLVLISMTSCLGSKKVSEKSSVSTSKEVTDKKTDSTAKETINKGIKDEATFKIPESTTGDIDFDQRVNDAVTSILRSINFQKSSGDNSYLIRFNEKLNQLEAMIEVGQTSNKEVATNKEETSEKEKSETFTETFKKTVMTFPWWVWVVLFIAFFRRIMEFVGNIYPPARGITSIADLFNPPKRD